MKASRESDVVPKDVPSGAIEVTLPLPPSELSPNGRCCWQKKSRLTKKMRAEATFVLRMHPDRPLRPWKALTIRATFYVARVGDQDNRLASLKSAFDSFADAGWITNDRSITHLPPLQVVEKADRRVVLEVWPA